MADWRQAWGAVSDAVSPCVSPGGAVTAGSVVSNSETVGLRGLRGEGPDLVDEDGTAKPSSGTSST
jgi:hypothetical protein